MRGVGEGCCAAPAHSGNLGELQGDYMFHKAMLALSLFFLSALPAYADGASPGFTDEEKARLNKSSLAYFVCANEKAIEYAKIDEAADVVAEGALGACAVYARAFEVDVREVARIDGQRLQLVIAQNREDLKSRLIAKIIEIRLAP